MNNPISTNLRWKLLLNIYNNLVYRSIFLSTLISLFIPFVSLYLPPNIFIFDWSLQSFAYFEVVLTSQSMLWLVIRFLPLVPLSYLNGLLLKNKLKILKRKNLYLVLSSLLIYFISFVLGILIMYIMTFIPIFNKLLEATHVFSI